MGILADELRLQGRPVPQGELVGFYGADDVAVGEGVAIWRDQHPGADSADADDGRADRFDDRDDGARITVQEIDVRDHSWVVPNHGPVKQVLIMGNGGTARFHETDR